MASKITGSNLAYRYKVENDYDPATGNVFVEYWNGPKIAIQSLAEAFKAAGAKVRTTHTGPRWEMVVRVSAQAPGAGAPPEVPEDQWSIDVDFAQVSLWAHPEVDYAMEHYVDIDDPPALLPASRFRKDIETAIKTGAYPTTLAFGGVQNPTTAKIGLALYNSLVRGQDSYEIKKPTLTKTRMYSPAYVERFVLDQTEKVFTTGTLVALMSVPLAIQRQLPTDPPSKATGTAWAWKVRTSRTEFIPALGKIRETRDWVFAMWSVDTAGKFGLYALA